MHIFSSNYQYKPIWVKLIFTSDYQNKNYLLCTYLFICVCIFYFINLFSLCTLSPQIISTKYILLSIQKQFVCLSVALFILFIFNKHIFSYYQYKTYLFMYLITFYPQLSIINYLFILYLYITIGCIVAILLYS